MAISTGTYISKDRDMSEKILTFLHSGDAGDMIAGLGAVKELCEKENAKALLFLDTTGGMTCNSDELNKIIFGQTKGKGLKFNDGGYEFLKPLIEAQTYIAKVEKWTPLLQVQIDYNLNEFRRAFVTPEIAKKTNQNLMFLHQNAIGLEFKYNGPWLDIPSDINEKHSIIVARTSRYTSAHGFFAIHETTLKDNAEFIGTDFEYELFKNAFGYQPKRFEVKTALDAAKAIKNSDMLICNGTIFYWIGVGLGHQSIIHELGIDIPTTYFPNQDPPTIRYIEGAHFVR